MEEEYKLGNTIQEFEELFGNVPFEDIEKIKKWLFNNYIPISVIQNKKKELEEVQDMLVSNNIDKPTYQKELQYAIDILQELLEERR